MNCVNETFWPVCDLGTCMKGDDAMPGIAEHPAQSAAEHTVDLWLRRSLAEAYEPVLNERLPESWLAMIRRRTSP